MTLPQELKIGEKVDTEFGEMERISENHFTLLQTRHSTQRITVTIDDINVIMALAGLNDKSDLQQMWE